MKTIAVLLTVFNRKDKTLECLKHLYVQNGIGVQYDIEVYLTDDGCTDGTPEAVNSLFPYVHIVKGNGSLFWNRGMLAAWKEASKVPYDYFLWLNDDTILFQDALIKLINGSIQFDDKSILIGSTCDSSTNSVVTYGGLDRNKNTVYSRDTFQKCYLMHGNIVLIPKYVFDIVGYNDGYYRHSHGDHDYGLMAQKKGIDVLVCPGFYGTCDIHGVIAKWKNPEVPLRDRWNAFFKPTGNNPFEFFYFRKKHYGLIPACKSFITNFIHLFFPSFWKNDDLR